MMKRIGGFVLCGSPEPDLNEDQVGGLHNQMESKEQNIDHLDNDGDEKASTTLNVTNSNSQQEAIRYNWSEQKSFKSFRYAYIFKALKISFSSTFLKW